MRDGSPDRGSGGKDPSPWYNDVEAAALKSAAAGFALAAAYQDELTQSVFRLRASDPQKLRLARQNVLADLNTFPVLQFVWKESLFVSADALTAAGIQRLTHGGPLTVQTLTTLLHTGASNISAALRRVDAILRAGKAYGLIETRAIDSKMIEIAGTAVLHAFMLRVYVGQVIRLPPPPDGDEERDAAMSLAQDCLQFTRAALRAGTINALDAALKRATRRLGFDHFAVIDHQNILKAGSDAVFLHNLSGRMGRHPLCPRL